MSDNPGMDKTDDPSMDKTWKFFWLNFYILQTNSKQDSTWTGMNNTKTKTLKQYPFPEEKALSMIILDKYLLLKNIFGVKTLSLTQSWQRRRAHSCLIGNLHHRFNPRGSTAAKGGRGHSQKLVRAIDGWEIYVQRTFGKLQDVQDGLDKFWQSGNSTSIVHCSKVHSWRKKIF